MALAFEGLRKDQIMSEADAEISSLTALYFCTRSLLLDLKAPSWSLFGLGLALLLMVAHW
jgi:hypothetical protein